MKYMTDLYFLFPLVNNNRFAVCNTKTVILWERWNCDLAGRSVMLLVTTIWQLWIVVTFCSFHVCTCVSFSHTSFKNSFKKFQLLSSNPGVELAPEDPSHHVHITQTSAGHDMTWVMLSIMITSGLGFIAVFCENVVWCHSNKP